MNAPSLDTLDTMALPSLIDRAVNALSYARSSAEVLEARDMARVAYDAARTAGRMARAKSAHDHMIGVVYRMQADAVLIEARAKIRLADEYDAAQARGEVKRNGGDRSSVDDHNTASAADLGLRRDEIHEARKIRDAERDNPGLIDSALDAVEHRQEPTRAELQRSIHAAISDARKPVDRKNHDRKPDPLRDMVLDFIEHCEQLAQVDCLAPIAHIPIPVFRPPPIDWTRPPLRHWTSLLASRS